MSNTKRKGILTVIITLLISILMFSGAAAAALQSPTAYSGTSERGIVRDAGGYDPVGDVQLLQDYIKAAEDFKGVLYEGFEWFLNTHAALIKDSATLEQKVDELFFDNWPASFADGYAVDTAMNTLIGGINGLLNDEGNFSDKNDHDYGIALFENMISETAETIGLDTNDLTLVWDEIALLAYRMAANEFKAALESALALLPDSLFADAANFKNFEITAFFGGWDVDTRPQPSFIDGKIGEVITSINTFFATPANFAVSIENIEIAFSSMMLSLTANLNSAIAGLDSSATTVAGLWDDMSLYFYTAAVNQFTFAMFDGFQWASTGSGGFGNLAADLDEFVTHFEGLFNDFSGWRNLDPAAGKEPVDLTTFDWTQRSLNELVNQDGYTWGRTFIDPSEIDFVMEGLIDNIDVFVGDSDNFSATTDYDRVLGIFEQMVDGLKIYLPAINTDTDTLAGAWGDSFASVSENSALADAKVAAIKEIESVFSQISAYLPDNALENTLQSDIDAIKNAPNLNWVAQYLENAHSHINSYFNTKTTFRKVANKVTEDFQNYKDLAIEDLRYSDKAELATLEKAYLFLCEYDDQFMAEDLASILEGMLYRVAHIYQLEIDVNTNFFELVIDEQSGIECLEWNDNNIHEFFLPNDTFEFTLKLVKGYEVTSVVLSDVNGIVETLDSFDSSFEHEIAFTKTKIDELADNAGKIEINLVPIEFTFDVVVVLDKVSNVIFESTITVTYDEDLQGFYFSEADLALSENTGGYTYNDTMATFANVYFDGYRLDKFTGSEIVADSTVFYGNAKIYVRYITINDATVEYLSEDVYGVTFDPAAAPTYTIGYSDVLIATADGYGSVQVIAINPLSAISKYYRMEGSTKFTGLDTSKNGLHGAIIQIDIGEIDVLDKTHTIYWYDAAQNLVAISRFMVVVEDYNTHDIEFIDNVFDDNNKIIQVLDENMLIELDGTATAEFIESGLAFKFGDRESIDGQEYVFVGWYLNEDPTEYLYYSDERFYDDAEYIALWALADTILTEYVTPLSTYDPGDEEEGKETYALTLDGETYSTQLKIWIDGLYKSENFVTDTDEIEALEEAGLYSGGVGAFFATPSIGGFGTISTYAATTYSKMSGEYGLDGFSIQEIENEWDDNTGVGLFIPFADDYQDLFEKYDEHFDRTEKDANGDEYWIINFILIFMDDDFNAVCYDFTYLLKVYNEYMVTFDANGGNFESASIFNYQTVAYGNPVTELENAPTRRGYDFAGWYLTKDGTGDKYDFSTPVEGEVILYAAWDVWTYTIKYYASEKDAEEAEIEGYEPIFEEVVEWTEEFENVIKGLTLADNKVFDGWRWYSVDEGDVDPSEAFVFVQGDRVHGQIDCLNGATVTVYAASALFTKLAGFEYIENDTPTIDWMLPENITLTELLADDSGLYDFLLTKYPDTVLVIDYKGTIANWKETEIMHPDVVGNAAGTLYIRVAVTAPGGATQYSYSNTLGEDLIAVEYIDGNSTDGAFFYIAIAEWNSNIGEWVPYGDGSRNLLLSDIYHNTYNEIFWYDDDSNMVSAEYGVFTQMDYQEVAVTLNHNNAQHGKSEPVYETIQVLYGSEIREIATPEYDGYTFKEWVRAATGKVIAGTAKVTYAMTLIAQYDYDEITVDFQDNIYGTVSTKSGTLIEPVTVLHHHYIDETALAIPYKAGQTFEYWTAIDPSEWGAVAPAKFDFENTYFDVDKANYNIVSEGYEVTLYAYFVEKMVNVYIYGLDGDTTKTPELVRMPLTEALDNNAAADALFDTLSYAKHAFDGWRYNSVDGARCGDDFENAFLESQLDVNDAIHIYARWIPYTAVVVDGGIPSGMDYTSTEDTLALKYELVKDANGHIIELTTETVGVTLISGIAYIDIIVNPGVDGDYTFSGKNGTVPSEISKNLDGTLTVRVAIYESAKFGINGSIDLEFYVFDDITGDMVTACKVQITLQDYVRYLIGGASANSNGAIYKAINELLMIYADDTIYNAILVNNFFLQANTAYLQRTNADSAEDIIKIYNDLVDNLKQVDEQAQKLKDFIAYYNQNFSMADYSASGYNGLQTAFANGKLLIKNNAEYYNIAISNLHAVDTLWEELEEYKSRYIGELKTTSVNVSEVDFAEYLTAIQNVELTWAQGEAGRPTDLKTIRDDLDEAKKLVDKLYNLTYSYISILDARYGAIKTLKEQLGSITPQTLDSYREAVGLIDAFIDENLLLDADGTKIDVENRKYYTTTEVTTIFGNYFTSIVSKYKNLIATEAGEYRDNALQNFIDAVDTLWVKYEADIASDNEYNITHEDKLAIIAAGVMYDNLVANKLDDKSNVDFKTAYDRYLLLKGLMNASDALIEEILAEYDVIKQSGINIDNIEASIAWFNGLAAKYEKLHPTQKEDFNLTLLEDGYGDIYDLYAFLTTALDIAVKTDYVDIDQLLLPEFTIDVPAAADAIPTPVVPDPFMGILSTTIPAGTMMNATNPSHAEIQAQINSYINKYDSASLVSADKNDWDFLSYDDKQYFNYYFSYYFTTENEQYDIVMQLFGKHIYKLKEMHEYTQKIFVIDKEDYNSDVNVDYSDFESVLSTHRIGSNPAGNEYYFENAVDGEIEIMFNVWAKDTFRLIEVSANGQENVIGFRTIEIIGATLTLKTTLNDITFEAALIIYVVEYKDAAEGENITDIANMPDPLDVLVTYGNTLTKPADPRSASHNFAGWYYIDALGNEVDFTFAEVFNKAFVNDQTAGTSSDVILYARWQIKEYTVTIEYYAGDGYDITNVKWGTNLLNYIPEDPADLDSFIFAGWYLWNDGYASDKYDFSTEVTDNITIKARWVEVTNLTYDHLTIYETYNPLALDMVRSDKYTAEFEFYDLSTKFNLEFGVDILIDFGSKLGAGFNGNEATNYDRDFDDSGAILLLIINSSEVVSKDGNVENYYYIKAYDDNGNLLFVFRFSINIQKYTEFTYTYNFLYPNPPVDQILASTDTNKVYQGTKAALLTPIENEGYTFEGWYTSTSFDEADRYGINTLADGDLTLYANWTINVYTVTYYDENGEFLHSEKVNYDNYLVEALIALELIDLDGKRFIGWFTDNSGLAVKAFNSDVNKVKGELNLYAWVVNEIEFKKGDFTLEYSPKTAGGNDSVVVIDNDLDIGVALDYNYAVDWASLDSDLDHGYYFVKLTLNVPELEDLYSANANGLGNWIFNGEYTEDNKSVYIRPAIAQKVVDSIVPLGNGVYGDDNGIYILLELTYFAEDGRILAIGIVRVALKNYDAVTVTIASAVKCEFDASGDETITYATSDEITVLRGHGIENADWYKPASESFKFNNIPGLTFKKWELRRGATKIDFDFETDVFMSDFTELVAIYDITEYDVEFVDRAIDGSYTYITSIGITVSHAGYLAKPDNVFNIYDGHSYGMYWTLDNPSTWEDKVPDEFIFTTQITGSMADADGKITLYAYYPVNAFEVTFKSAEDGEIISKVTGVYGGTITKPADPAALTNEVFVGWYWKSTATAEAELFDFSAGITTGDIRLASGLTEITIYAKFTTVTTFSGTIDGKLSGIIDGELNEDIVIFGGNNNDGSYDLSFINSTDFTDFIRLNWNGLNAKYTFTVSVINPDYKALKINGGDKITVADGMITFVFDLSEGNYPITGGSKVFEFIWYNDAGIPQHAERLTVNFNYYADLAAHMAALMNSSTEYDDGDLDDFRTGLLPIVNYLEDGLKVIDTHIVEDFRAWLLSGDRAFYISELQKLYDELSMNGYDSEIDEIIKSIRDIAIMKIGNAINKEAIYNIYLDASGQMEGVLDTHYARAIQKVKDEKTAVDGEKYAAYLGRIDQEITKAEIAIKKQYTLDGIDRERDNAINAIRAIVAEADLAFAKAAALNTIDGLLPSTTAYPDLTDFNTAIAQAKGKINATACDTIGKVNEIVAEVTAEVNEIKGYLDARTTAIAKLNVPTGYTDYTTRFNDEVITAAKNAINESKDVAAIAQLGKDAEAAIEILRIKIDLENAITQAILNLKAAVPTGANYTANDFKEAVEKYEGRINSAKNTTEVANYLDDGKAAIKAIKDAIDKRVDTLAQAKLDAKADLAAAKPTGYTAAELELIQELINEASSKINAAETVEGVTTEKNAGLKAIADKIRDFDRAIAEKAAKEAVDNALNATTIIDIVMDVLKDYVPNITVTPTNALSTAEVDAIVTLVMAKVDTTDLSDTAKDEVEGYVRAYITNIQAHLLTYLGDALNNAIAAEKAQLTANTNAAINNENKRDANAAATVTDMINGLSKKSSKSDITAARTAFDGLSDRQQKLVTNEQTLIALENPDNTELLIWITIILLILLLVIAVIIIVLIRKKKNNNNDKDDNDGNGSGTDNRRDYKENQSQNQNSTNRIENTNKVSEPVKPAQDFAIVEEISEDDSNDDAEDALDDMEEDVEEEAEDVIEEALDDVDSSDSELAFADFGVAESGKNSTVRKSMLERLVETGSANKYFYSAVKNELFSYRNVRCRMTKTIEKFAVKRIPVAKISLVGKTLRLYLALNPNAYDEKQYHHKNVGDKRRYELTPMMVKIKSQRSVNKAFELIADVMTERELLKRRKFVETDYVMQLRNKPLTVLGARELDHLIVDEITAEDVNVVAEISDYDAGKCVEIREIQKIKDPVKETVSLDIINSNFKSGELVDLKQLLKKKLVPAGTNYIKISHEGILNKVLTIVANSFSDTAVKMIVLVGGMPVCLKDKE